MKYGYPFIKIALCLAIVFTQTFSLNVKADITLSPTTGGTYCNGGDPITITATATPTPPSYDCPCNADGSSGNVIPDPNNPTTYTWSGDATGSGDTATIGTNTTGGSPSTKTATVTATYYWTCDSDPNADIAPTTDGPVSATYTILPPLSFTTNGAAICAGASVMLGPGVGGSGSGYSFSSSDNMIASVDSSTGNVTSGSRDGEAVITLTDSNGCTTTCVVTVQDSTISGPNSVGVLDTITLTCSHSNVKWSSSDNSIATVGQNSGVVIGAGPGTVSIYAIIPGGCEVAKDVTVTAAPETLTVTITNPSNKKTIVLEGVNQAFSCTASGGDGNYTYSWTRDDTGANFSSLATTNPITFGAPDLDVPVTILVTVTDGSGNQGGAKVEVDIPAIKDYTAAGTTYSVNASNNSPLIVGAMMNLTVDVPNHTISTWSWNVGGIFHAGWDSERSTSTLSEVTNTISNEISYYYADGSEDSGPVQTTCSITTSDGASCTVPASFTVDLPNDPGLAVNNQQHPVDEYNYGSGVKATQWLEYGPGQTQLPADMGIKESWTNPPQCPDGFTGQWAIVQVMGSANDSGTTGLLLPFSRTVNYPQGDSVPPSNLRVNWYGDAPGAELVYHTLSDEGPIIPQRDFNNLTLNESYTTWLMFKPNIGGTTAQWVPIECWQWSFAGTATWNTDNPPTYSITNTSRSLSDYDFGNALDIYPVYSGNTHDSPLINWFYGN